jgi:hypothetical protein
MGAMQFPKHCGHWNRTMTQAILIAACWAGAVAAQTTPIPTTAVADGGVTAGMLNSNIIQTGCSSCGGGMSLPPMSGGGCGENCVPGRTCGGGCGSGYCDDSVFGRFVHGLYDCICCPDPCYEPQWLAVANAAFFVDGARPKTQMALKVFEGFDVKQADRAEYFWARESVNQAEPNQAGSRHGTGKGPNYIPRDLDFEDFRMYVEGGTASFSAFVETPYREIDPTAAAISPNPGLTASGFGDITAGTKSLLLDCELLQLALEFKTFIPAGNFSHGLGTGHVSLEPSILFSLKLSSEMYAQGQLSYWIPIAGDPLYQGNVFHCHFSLNRKICKITDNVFIVGTAEVNEWSPLGGNYTGTDFLFNGQPLAISATTAMVSVGPGVRLYVCDNYDIGVGSAFALTGDRWAKEEFHVEFRWRF